MQPAILPIWVEYVKALGAPVVALVAATIAGSIAYRQWNTARNKLKLDLFEKRLKVYDAAVELLKAIAMPEPVDWEFIRDASARMSAATWLFNREVADHLSLLVARAYQTTGRGKLDPASMTDEQKMELVLGTVKDQGPELMQELQKLDKLMGDHLTVTH